MTMACRKVRLVLTKRKWPFYKHLSCLYFRDPRYFIKRMHHKLTSFLFKTLDSQKKVVWLHRWSITGFIIKRTYFLLKFLSASFNKIFSPIFIFDMINGFYYKICIFLVTCEIGFVRCYKEDCRVWWESLVFCWLHYLLLTWS